MTKVDLMAVAKMIRDSEGDDWRPPDDDGPAVHLPYKSYPLVKTGDIYGYASVYTRSYVMVRWQDGTGKVHSEWFAAAEVQRVESEDWHGIPSDVLVRHRKQSRPHFRG